MVVVAAALPVIVVVAVSDVSGIVVKDNPVVESEVCIFIILLRVLESHPLRRILLLNWKLLDEANGFASKGVWIHVLVHGSPFHDLPQVRSSHNVWQTEAWIASTLVAASSEPVTM